MNDNWRYKIEQDIQTLAHSISQLSMSLEKFIEYSKEIQDNKFSKLNNQVADHEERIRHNSKFIYQATAIITLIVTLINVIIQWKF